jgi:hypothetical protein
MQSPTSMQRFKPLQPFASYKLAGQLKGHKNAVHALALNRTGSLLVSGGRCNAIIVHVRLT